MENKLKLSRKSARELIELKQELGYIAQDLEEEYIEKLIDEMVKVTLGRLQ